MQELKIPMMKSIPDSIDTKARTLRAIISTNNIDRDGEIIEPSAFKDRIESFERNPILLWMHQAFEPPIGRVQELTFHSDRVEASVKFAEGQERAEDIFSLFKQSMLSTFSIGFPRADGCPATAAKGAEQGGVILHGIVTSDMGNERPGLIDPKLGADFGAGLRIRLETVGVDAVVDHAQPPRAIAELPMRPPSGFGVDHQPCRWAQCTAPPEHGRRSAFPSAAGC